MRLGRRPPRLCRTVSVRCAPVGRLSKVHPTSVLSGLGKPSAQYFATALEELDAEAGLTWMVGDDLEGDIVGAHRHGMKTILVRTGKFRPDEVEQSGVLPDGILSSVAQLPDWLESNP